MKAHNQPRAYPQWRSMSYRLPAAYAVIALLVVLVLGAVLFLSLRNYYASQERAYLEAHSKPMAYVLGEMLLNAGPEDWQAQVNLFSFLARAQVKVLDRNGLLLSAADIFEADPFFAEPQGDTQGFFVSAERIDGEMGFNYLLISAGNPNTLVMEDSNTLQMRQVDSENPVDLVQQTVSVPAQGTAGQRITFASATRPDVPLELIPSSFGGAELAMEGGFSERVFMERSTVILDEPIVAADGSFLGTLRLSDGPAYGGIIIRGVMSGWLLASVVSVGLAILLGWVASRDVINPLRTLTLTTKRMAEGDLSARVMIRREDEFGSLAQSFNDMASQIEMTVNTLQRFVSDAAHEINTPITALRTNLELMQGVEVDRALGQLRRLQDLSSKLLQLSRLESDIEESSVESIEANALVQEAAQFYASQAEQAQVRLIMNLSEKPVYFKANRSQMQTALSNLLHNAIKFTPKEGTVQISVQGNDALLRFIVEDTGIGIPSEDLPFLFNRFHRGRNAARYTGSGLGLAIVQAIVNRYEGQVKAETCERGAKFVIELETLV
jgi:signal transduction histidine kinase